MKLFRKLQISLENWVNLDLYVTANPKRLLPVIMKVDHYQKGNLKQTSNFIR